MPSSVRWISSGSLRVKLRTPTRASTHNPWCSRTLRPPATCFHRRDSPWAAMPTPIPQPSIKRSCSRTDTSSSPCSRYKHTRVRHPRHVTTDTRVQDNTPVCVFLQVSACYCTPGQYSHSSQHYRAMTPVHYSAPQSQTLPPQQTGTNTRTSCLSGHFLQGLWLERWETGPCHCMRFVVILTVNRSLFPALTPQLSPLTSDLHCSAGRLLLPDIETIFIKHSSNQSGWTREKQTINQLFIAKRLYFIKQTINKQTNR